MAIKNVTLTCKRDEHWRSKGITVSDGSFVDAVCKLTINNKNSYKVKIDTITLPLGTGSGSLYGWVTNTKRGLFTVNGASCSAKIIKNDDDATTVATKNITTVVTVASYGSASESGYFNNPSGGTTFNCSDLYVGAKKSITLGIGVDGGSGSTSGPVLSCHNGYGDDDGDDNQISANVDCTGSICSCSISNIKVNYTERVVNASVTASCNAGSNQTKNWQWQKKSGSKWSDIDKATSATYTATVAGKYRCKITITRSGYKEASGTTGEVTYYGTLSTPSGLSIVGSKTDNRYTNKEDYTFKWNAVGNATNNAVTDYAYEIWVSGTKKKSGTTKPSLTTSVTFTSADLGLVKGSKLKFTVIAKGEELNSNTATSAEIDIVSAAVIHVNKGYPNSNNWVEGIVYVNGSEADEVLVKDGSSWKSAY